MVTKNAFENAFFNLMNNAVFRKKQKKNYLVSEPKYYTTRIF